MRNRLARAGLLVALFAILLSGCGWFASDGSLIISIGELPEGITQITVTVTGDGMDPVSGEFSGDPADSEPLIIPEGTGREWTVVVDVDNATPVTQYTAEGTADIVGGEITEVTASLVVSGSAVIVLDELGERLVMLDGPNGDEENYTFSSFDAVYGLFDAEIGPDGYIYVLYTDETLVLEKLTSFADTSRDRLNDLVFGSGVGLAIDHPNRTIFYAHNDGLPTLRSLPLGGGTETVHTPAIASGSEIFGLAADNSGNVYMVYSEDNESIKVAKFDPNPAGGAGAIVNAVTVSGADTTGNHFDVLWKAGKVYVADSSTNTIAVFADDLSSQTNIGSAYPDDESPVDAGEFVGPSRFAGHGNPSIYVLDDDPFSSFDAVAEFADDAFGSWQRRNAPDLVGTSPFDFWEQIPQ